MHCALFLIQTLFGVAVLFVSELAHFLAAVQVGITVASFLAAAYGAAEIAPLIQAHLQA